MPIKFQITQKVELFLPQVSNIKKFDENVFCLIPRNKKLPNFLSVNANPNLRKIHDLGRTCVNDSVNRHLFVLDAYEGYNRFELKDEETGEIIVEAASDRRIIRGKGDKANVNLPKRIAIVKSEIVNMENNLADNTIDIDFKFYADKYQHFRLGQFLNKNSFRNDLYSQFPDLINFGYSGNLNCLLILYHESSVYSRGDFTISGYYPLCISPITQDWENLEDMFD